MTGGAARPERSPIHRLPAGVKLAVLAAAGSLAFLATDWRWLAAGMVAVCALYFVAGLGVRGLLTEMRRFVWIAVVLLAVQAALGQWMTGLEVALRLYALVMLAALVTLTTRTSAIIATLERLLAPLDRVGMSSARIALAVSLAFRFIPLIAEITREVREAQRARGLERSLVAVALPVIVRALKMADDIADAIDARGFDPAPRRRPRSDRSRP